jgi:hypothetical protein
MAAQFHLAQVNVARMLAPLSDPLMADFVARIGEINALAEGSPGFVWRLKDDEGSALYIRPFEDERILFNLSVWESVEALSAFVYRSDHRELIARRKEWFALFDRPYQALWWIAAGSIPTVDDAKERLNHLQENGPSAFAFGFKTVFATPPDLAAEAVATR